jgi:hypothetical protein
MTTPRKLNQGNASLAPSWGDTILSVPSKNRHKCKLPCFCDRIRFHDEAAILEEVKVLFILSNHRHCLVIPSIYFLPANRKFRDMSEADQFSLENMYTRCLSRIEQGAKTIADYRRGWHIWNFCTFLVQSHMYSCSWISENWRNACCIYRYQLHAHGQKWQQEIGIGRSIADSPP